MSDDILVYADWASLQEPTLIGVLSADQIRGREQFRFQYEDSWLTSDQVKKLDPELELYSGNQFPSGDGNFRVFLDSCPDRWGELLMTRREALRAHDNNRKPRKLMDSDYLLGVHDRHRMGALRFKTVVDGPFLDDDQEMAAPPWARLRELEHAAHRVEEQGASYGADYRHWLAMLLAPGSSLGGARPKASVIDEHGALWIAKFPSRRDTYDVGLWEFLVYRLADQAGVHMAPCKIERFSGNYHTFLTQRFDRNGEQRIHFSSAMTQLGRNDGDDGASYLELAEFLIQHGSSPTADLKQLWRRVVFNIAVSNTDDHLRNHGFLLNDDGWSLSPAYDINADPAGTGLSLFVSDKDNRLDFDLAISVAKFFQLNPTDAKKICSEVQNATQQWPEIAAAIGVSKGERSIMGAAFNSE